MLWKKWSIASDGAHSFFSHLGLWFYLIICCFNFSNFFHFKDFNFVLFYICLFFFQTALKNICNFFFYLFLNMDSLSFIPHEESHNLSELPSLLLLWCYLSSAAAAAARSLQSCPTLCDPIDGSPPGFTIPGILQARILEWVAISFSNAWKWKVKVQLLSRVWLFATPWTAAHQAPPSMGFSR